MRINVDARQAKTPRGNRVGGTSLPASVPGPRPKAGHADLGMPQDRFSGNTDYNPPARDLHGMAGAFDREKVVECMFDPVTSSILAALEDGRKECSQLAEGAGIAEDEVLGRLSYLIEHGFVLRDGAGGGCILEADTEKLDSIVEGDGNFEGAISGLEKMDSYLN